MKEVLGMKMKTVWFEGDCIKCSMCVEEAWYSPLELCVS